MKCKKLISVFACSFLLLGGGTLLAVQSASKGTARRVKADTDVGEIVIEKAYGASNATRLYIKSTETNDMPKGWNTSYHLVDGNNGVFLNGNDQGDVEIVKCCNFLRK